MMETLDMSDRQAELKAAKARLSAAAVACLENRPGAAEAAGQARGEVAALLTRTSSANSCAQAEKMNLAKSRST